MNNMVIKMDVNFLSMILIGIRNVRGKLLVGDKDDTYWKPFVVFNEGECFIVELRVRKGELDCQNHPHYEIYEEGVG